MKKQSKTKTRVMVRVAAGLLIVAALVGCGGSSSPSDQNQSGNWDTLVWDQDNWH